jgi:hypothetical protein
MHPSYLVQTPYGKAKVLDAVAVAPVSGSTSASAAYRRYELELIDWAGSSSAPQPDDKTGPSRRPPKLFSAASFPSVSPTVGAHVITTCFHQPMLGRVVSVRPLDRVATVRLYDWCLLNQNSMVTCHFSYGSLQVVDPPHETIQSLPTKSSDTTSELVKKLLDIQQHKNLGYQLYKSHSWSSAHAEFEATSSMIAQLLVLKTKTLIRGNLILTCIKCSNYMAICKLWRNELALSIKHCMDALYLLRSLEVKTSRRYRDFFGKYAGEIRVFGCWRIKTLQIMAHVFLEKRQYSAAKDLLRQAHKVATKLFGISATNQELERRLAQLSRSDRATLRLYSIVARQLAGHDAAKEASRLWLLEEGDDDDAHWPPLPIDENEEESAEMWTTPPRRRVGASSSSSTSSRRKRRETKQLNKSIDSPGTYVTEASSFDEDQMSCASDQTGDTASTAATFFRNLVSKGGAGSPTSVKALVPSDTNIYARDKKVFEARKNYLDTVVQKTNLPGTTISFDSSRSLKGSSSGHGGGGSSRSVTSSNAMTTPPSSPRPNPR